MYLKKTATTRVKTLLPNFFFFFPFRPEGEGGGWFDAGNEWAPKNARDEDEQGQGTKPHPKKNEKEKKKHGKTR